MLVPGSRRILATVLALGLVLTAAGTAAAAPPTGDRAGAAQAKPGGGGGGGGGGPKPTRGYDISYPQCGAPYPANPAFGIVGVNGGRVFSVNPCLASQITWGGGAKTELYVNTGNPGPGAVAASGRAGRPRRGSATRRTSIPPTAPTTTAGTRPGSRGRPRSRRTRPLRLTASPAATAWWLDVETSNSWRSNTALNVAAIQGEVDYLRSVGITRLGVYSTTVQWGQITGGTTAFATLPSWGAGAPSEKAAKQHCVSTPGFTGGRLAMVQFIVSGFDADIRC